MKSKPSAAFGSFAKQARLSKGLGLRQAARKMEVEAAYLSRVENGLESPSGRLIAQMSHLYGTSIEELTHLAAKPKASAAAHGHAMQASPELRALYRLGVQLDSEAIEKIIRRVLSEWHVTDEEIEKQLARLKSELPRVTNGGRDGPLFAAEAKPRFLAARQITRIAYQMLEANALGEGNYHPPTPIELIVDNEPGVLYRIEELKCDKHGDPLVLGLTGWGEGGERQIVVNSVLTESRRKSDASRFNFTLAHELFHAIEHLPRVPREAVEPMARTRVFVDEREGQPSAAERAVSRWAGIAGPRRLTTNEDWREWQANRFASAILMPEWAVKAEFVARTGDESVSVKTSTNLREAALEIADGRVFDADVYGESLAELFDVSRQAMAIRLLQLNLLQEADG
jgi:transcriptional regulator with XRE-family HTH domain